MIQEISDMLDDPEMRDEAMGYDINLDKIIASAAHARMTRDTTLEHLAKIWRIDLETAKKTLGITLQHCAHAPGEEGLARNFSTNDRML